MPLGGLLGASWSAPGGHLGSQSVHFYKDCFKKINWKEIRKFDGFSDHTLGITAPIIFSLIKKQMKIKEIFIEKYVKLKNSKGPDASSSIDTNELKVLVDQVRTIEKLRI